MNGPADRESKIDNGAAWDVVVIGAGPSGALAAFEAARLGASVLLVDRAKFPRYKVCGCCLNGRALAALESAGLGGLVDGHGGVALREFVVAAKGRSARLGLPGGAALSREVLDLALIQVAVGAGATFLEGRKAAVVHGRRDGWSLRLHGPDDTLEVVARVVIAADGLAGKIVQAAVNSRSQPEESALIGAGVMLTCADSRYKSGTIYMAVGTGGYVGAVRVEDGRLNLGAALDRAFVRKCGGLAPAALAVLTEAGFEPPEPLDDAVWRGTPALTRRAERVAAHRLFVVGDAAAYVEPFTGEGMAWAIAAGRAVAPIACRAVDAFGIEHEREWTARYRELTAAAQRRCRLVAGGLRRPGLVRAAIFALGRAPQLARPIIGRLNAGIPAREEAQS